MSIRSNGSGDKLYHQAASPMVIDTGAYCFGIGVRLVADRNGETALAAITNDPNPAEFYNGVYCGTDGTSIRAPVYAITELVPGVSLTVGTWYWLVYGRDGSGNATVRVFADSSSTTPLGSASVADPTDWTQAGVFDFDTFLIGDAFGLWADAEFRVAKVHLGAYWSDSEAVAEMTDGTQILKAGGTKWGAWTLKDLATGLADGTGNSRTLTNSGMADGGTEPSYIGSEEEGVEPPSAVLSGTVEPDADAEDIVSGGETIIATISDGTLAATTLTPATSAGTAKSTTTAPGRTGNGDITVSFPAGYTPVAGDLCIIGVYNDQGDASTPSGFTEVTGSPFGSATPKLCIFYKVLAGGESAPVTTISGSGTNIAHCANMAIVPNGKGIGAVGTASDGTGTPMTAAEVTTTAVNSLVQMWCGRGDNENASGQTFGGSSTGVTEVLDGGSDQGNDSQVSMAEKLIASIGGSGAGSATTSATDPWVAVQIEILCKTPFADARRATIDGLVSDVDPTDGWNDQVANIPESALVRTSDTVMTLTLPALAGYTNEGEEEIEWTIPQAMIVGAADDVVAAPTFIINGVVGDESETVEVPAAALELTPFAPTTLAPNTITVPTRSLELQTFAPDPAVPNSVVVPPASLELSPRAPTVIAPYALTVPAAALELSPTVPEIEYVVDAEPVVLELTTHTPTVQAGGLTVTVPTREMLLTRPGPTVIASDHKWVTAPAAALECATYAPTVATTANVWVVVDSAALRITHYEPTVATTQHVSVVVPAHALALTALAPTVETTGNKAITVGAAGLRITHYEPTLDITADVWEEVPAASLALAAFAPTVTTTADRTVTVPSLALALLTYEPTAIGSIGRPTRRNTLGADITYRYLGAD